MRSRIAGDALAQIQVVEQLLAIVAFLGLRAVMVADARIDRNPIQHVPVGLKKGEEPVVVLVTAATNGKAEDAVPRIDVVAGRHDHAGVVLLEGELHRLRDLELPARRSRSENARAKVSDDDERERITWFC